MVVRRPPVQNVTILWQNPGQLPPGGTDGHDRRTKPLPPFSPSLSSTSFFPFLSFFSLSLCSLFGYTSFFSFSHPLADPERLFVSCLDFFYLRKLYHTLSPILNIILHSLSHQPLLTNILNSLAQWNFPGTSLAKIPACITAMVHIIYMCTCAAVDTRRKPYCADGVMGTTMNSWSPVSTGASALPRNSVALLLLTHLFFIDHGLR